MGALASSSWRGWGSDGVDQSSNDPASRSGQCLGSGIGTQRIARAAEDEGPPHAVVRADQWAGAESRARRRCTVSVGLPQQLGDFLVGDMDVASSVAGWPR